MGKYRRKYDGKTTAEEAEKKKYVDYKDCMFKINSIGEIEYALIHLPWDGNNDFDLRVRVRPRPDDVSCYVADSFIPEMRSFKPGSLVSLSGYSSGLSSDYTFLLDDKIMGEYGDYGVK